MDFVPYIEKAIAEEGYCMIDYHAKNASIKYKNGNLSNILPSDVYELAINMGLLTIDCSTANYEKLVGAALSKPMYVPGKNPDPQPWNMLSFCTKEAFIQNYKEAGCTIYNE